MKKEEVEKKLREAISSTMVGSGLMPMDGVEAIFNAALSVIGTCGAALGEDPKTFLRDIVKQAYDQLNQE